MNDECGMSRNDSEAGKMNQRRLFPSTASRSPAFFIAQLILLIRVSPLVPGDGLAFRVAKITTMDKSDTVLNNAVVLVRSGKIEAVGEVDQIRIPDGYETLDFSDHWLVPGLVDCHAHVGGGMGDINDSVYLTNPGLSTRDAVVAENPNIKRARAGGVTTVLFIPGSGTNLSGFGTIIKTGGVTSEEVVVRSPGSLKIAQAGNPERYWTGVGRSFMYWNTRQTLQRALDYHLAWDAFEKGETTDKPDYDPFFDDFRGLFRRDYPVTVHTQGYQLLMTTLDMLATKFKLWTVTDHSEFDGWKTAALFKRTDAWCIQGPRSYWFERTNRRMVGNAAGWWAAGVRNLGINTDSPVVPQEELFYQATMGCWYGWLPYPALRGVTIIPAQSLGIADRVGSIEAGKDADFGIWTGNPIDPRSACLMTLVDGKIVYDGRKGPRPF